MGSRRLLGAGLLAVAGGLPFIWPAGWLEPRLSEYKALRKTLLIPETEIVAERSGPLGLLSVVRSPRIPLRHAPGLSLAYRGGLPEQLGLFADGESLTAVDRFDETNPDLGYLGFLSSALPYSLVTEPRVLILGLGGGQQVSSALRSGARQVDVVEFNPQHVTLLRQELAGFGGHLLSRPGVRIHVAEARSFLVRQGDTWNLIQLEDIDRSAGGSAGPGSVGGSYLYTVEAFVQLIGQLRPGGYLTVTRQLEVPPRGGLKLFATGLEALERLGIQDPAQRLALIRSWSSVTLLLKNGDIDPSERQEIRRFCGERFFDIAFLADLAPAEVNRFNLLDAPYFYLGAKRLVGNERRQFFADYKFFVRPATDNRPYFTRFFTWRSLPELLALRKRGGAPLLEWGTLVMIATLVQAVLGGALLVLLPLRSLGASRPAGPGISMVAVFFAALGLAFLLLEIAFIERLTLFLGHPLYAVAVVLSGFLVCAGLGSGFARNLIRDRIEEVPTVVAGAILTVVGLSLVYLWLLPRFLAWALSVPDVWRVVISLVLIGPLAFAMGMPFPLGLGWVGARRPAAVPWAWGINGSASVVGAALAPLIAVHWGFNAVVLAAVVCYSAAGLTMRTGARPVKGVN
jgi:hypothetical protein